MQKSAHFVLVGNPNSGKSALFNRLTGAKQKVANYAGVTVEKKEGSFSYENTLFHVTDLPGTYSLNTLTSDEKVTQEVLSGIRSEKIDFVVLVADATNLRRNLQLTLEVKALGYPCILVLNMADIAKKRGLLLDCNILSQKLQMPVVETVAITADGIDALLREIKQVADEAPVPESIKIEDSQSFIQSLLQEAILQSPANTRIDDKIDAIVLHPIFGYIVLLGILFGMFQAVYSWSEYPMDWIESGIELLGEFVGSFLDDGALKSLLVDGIIAGVGSVLVFLPQILILFFFILILEESGYLPRAAFLTDRLMRSVGLSGRAFIPLLSCFACAVPGILATRTILDSRQRLATILIAPLMTCSARLPVYLLIIGAFIPDESVGIFNLQGLVLFALYLGGIISAMLLALVLRLFLKSSSYEPLFMELPAYHMPRLLNLSLGLFERAKIFLAKAGTFILALMVVLWFLSTYPSAPEGASDPEILYSFVGRLGLFIQPFFEPIGFNWQLAITLLPGMAAREASIGALGTIYALSQTGDALEEVLSELLARSWGLPTALSVLAWYVFSPQCIPMIMVIKREVNSWKIALAATVGFFALAYIASFIVYHLSSFCMGA